VNKRTLDPPSDPNEWDFSKIDPSELRACRDYEFGREVRRLESDAKKTDSINKPCSASGILEPRVMSIRESWNIRSFSTDIKETPTWCAFSASQVLVLFTEWPYQPYLEIDREECLRRIKSLSLPISKEQRLAYLSDLLEPDNPSTGPKKIIRLAIPLHLSHERILEAVHAFLKIYVPNQGKILKGKRKPQARLAGQGRGSEKARVADDLNALSVLRLENLGLLQAEIIHLIKHPDFGKNKGQRVYSEEKELAKPLHRIRRRIQEWRSQALADLNPLERLGIEPPDFSTLDCAAPEK
jgi:hypothetical protein